LQAGGQGIGLSYETKISKKLPVVFCAGVGGGYSISEDYFEYDFLNPAVYFSVSRRFFITSSKERNQEKLRNLIPAII